MDETTQEVLKMIRVLSTLTVLFVTLFSMGMMAHTALAEEGLDKADKRQARLFPPKPAGVTDALRELAVTRTEMEKGICLCAADAIDNPIMNL